MVMKTVKLKPMVVKKTWTAIMVKNGDDESINSDNDDNVGDDNISRDNVDNVDRSDYGNIH